MTEGYELSPPVFEFHACQGEAYQLFAEQKYVWKSSRLQKALGQAFFLGWHYCS